MINILKTRIQSLSTIRFENFNVCGPSKFLIEVDAKEFFWGMYRNVEVL